MEKFGVGQPLQRFEDPRLLRGEGRFIHDLAVPGQAYLVLVRSPHAHARIAAIDRSAAAAAPGVLGVFDGEDLVRDGVGAPEVSIKRKRPDGTPMFWRAHEGLARARVRFVGDPVVAVVAQTLAQAKDAADLVEIDYEALPIDGAVWDECPDNVCNVHEVGDAAATDAAFALAARVVSRRYVVSRVHAQFIEPRMARKVPAASSASSASLMQSRPCSSASGASLRSQVHFTGRPSLRASHSTWRCSTWDQPLAPNAPPTSPDTTRTASLGTLRMRSASRSRTRCGYCTSRCSV